MPDGTPSPPIPDTAQRAGLPDKLAELVAEMQSKAGAVSGKDPALSGEIGRISASIASSKADMTDEGFRSRVAYAFQDLEKLVGPIGTVPTDLRSEMTKLAGTAPGLENDQVRALMQATAGITNRDLLREIRSLAKEVGIDRGDQNTPDNLSRVEALENRMRKEQGPRIEQPTTSAKSATENETKAPGRSPETRTLPTADDQKEAPDQRPTVAALEAKARSSATVDAQTPADVAKTRTAPASQVQDPLGGILAQALNSLGNTAREVMTTATNAEAAVMSKVSTVMVDRVNRMEEAKQGARDEKVMQKAEVSGHAALEALAAATSGPLSGITSRISEAAKTTQGGEATVIAGMKAGGEFAELRSHFNADLASDKGAASALDKVSQTLHAYGADRAAVAEIGAKTNKAAAVDARFEKLDEQVATTGAAVPSRKEGNSVIEDLAMRIKEMLESAVQAVRNTVTPAAGPRSSPGPSASP